MKDDVCIGCGRNIEEIRDWGKLSHDDKFKIVSRIKGDKENSRDTSQH